MAQKKPLLEIKNLNTTFPTHDGLFYAVDDVSLDIARGETLCVVGESGSGKSVTARSVLQILDDPGKIEGGQIILNRSDEDTVVLTDLSPKSKDMRKVRGRDIAMIFQEPMSSLSSIYTIGNQIGEALILHKGMSKKEARERTIELLGQVEIPNPQEAVDRYPFEYSGGMRQRAMIAMALACDPLLLIADEPTTALDVTTQKEILLLIKNLQEKRNISVMFITHDMGVVAQIADRVVVMKHGKLLEEGKVTDIFKSPKDEYTRSLIEGAQILDRPSSIRDEMRKEKPIREPILRVENLGKNFVIRKGAFGAKRGETKAVDNVSFELRAGENLGIVGESGSGKTTLLRCILGLIETSSGSIIYKGRDGAEIDLCKLTSKELRPYRTEIRTIFQDPFASLNPRMTVEQIISEPFIVSGNIPEGGLHKKVMDLLDMVGLPGSSARKYPHAFSGGQRQRVAIARAIGPNPRIILADEPTSSLDVSLRIKMLELLLDLQKKLDISFIFVSHDIGVVKYFCDRIAVMYKGNLVEIGETNELCASPKHEYTRTLLSAVPVPDPSFYRA